MATPSIADLLLAWYDGHARDLPWRVKGPAGVQLNADPYRVWLSEIMLQQTTVTAVQPYFAKFLAAFPSVEALAAADDDEVMAMWAGLGYYARARNLLKCARAVVEDHNGLFPQTRDALKALPGIGEYTSAAIASIAFGVEADVVDGNVERVITRLFAMGAPLPEIKSEIKSRVSTMVPAQRPGDFAQAMMDLGATICTPKTPQCMICPISEACMARAHGRQDDFPVKAPKKAKPVRHGTVYMIVCGSDNAPEILLITRPEKGLLGGMKAPPTSHWSEAETQFDADAPFPGEWRKLPGYVRHVFTHFELKLSVARLTVESAYRQSACDAVKQSQWASLTHETINTLPTVFRKAVKHGL